MAKLQVSLYCAFYATFLAAVLIFVTVQNVEETHQEIRFDQSTDEFFNGLDHVRLRYQRNWLWLATIGGVILVAAKNRPIRVATFAFCAYSVLGALANFITSLVYAIGSL